MIERCKDVHACKAGANEVCPEGIRKIELSRCARNYLLYHLGLLLCRRILSHVFCSVGSTMRMLSAFCMHSESKIVQQRLPRTILLAAHRRPPELDLVTTTWDSGIKGTDREQRGGRRSRSIMLVQAKDTSVDIHHHVTP